MDDRHAVDKQHEVAAALIEHRCGGELRLSNDLIAAFAACNLIAVVNVERYGGAKVQRVVGIVTRDGY